MAATSEPPVPDATLAASGASCATLTPLIRARIRALESGQVLEVQSDDPAAREGVPAWCRLTGHELLAIVEDQAELRFYLRKR